jgi:hypothetical protein
MANMIALTVCNTVEIKGNTWKEIQEAQNKEVKNPAVLFIDKETVTQVEAFYLAAQTMEELRMMEKEQFYFTTSVEPGKHTVIDGRIFYGVELKEDTKKAVSCN